MTVKAFGSVEDLFEYLDELNKKGREQYLDVPPEKLAMLEPGCCFVRNIPEISVLIFGEILDADEDLAHAPHLRMARAYSVACPEGELGSLYVSTLTPLPREFFERARDRGWRVSTHDLIQWISESSALKDS